MGVFRKLLSSVLVLSIVCFYFPKIGLAGQRHLIAQADLTNTITEHKPEILSLPEEDIPFEKPEEPVEGKKTNWGWYVLGGLVVVALGAGLAAAGGGGGNGDGTTGDVKVSW